jgi:hypothetical protein
MRPGQGLQVARRPDAALSLVPHPVPAPALDGQDAVNATQAAILRALELCRVLDVEHNAASVHMNFRAVRHELKTLEGIHFPAEPEHAADAEAPELRSAQTGRATQPGSMRHKILAVLSCEPLADFQTVKELAKDGAYRDVLVTLHAVRRRRHELMAAGWVEPVLVGSQVRKATQESTGRDCTVYQLTDWGVTALKRLRSGQEVLFTDSELGHG